MVDIFALKPIYDPVPGVGACPKEIDLAPYPCLECRLRCNTEEELRLHRQWHKKDYQCTMCSKTFTTLKIFHDHIRRHYALITKDYSVQNQISATPIQCQHCAETFGTMRSQQLHMSLYSDTMAICEQCGYYLPSCHSHKPDPREEIKRQMGVREKTVRFEGVPEPSKIHTSVSTFKYHLSSTNSGLFNCQVCAQRLDSSKALQDHMNEHATSHILLYQSLDNFPYNKRLSLKNEGRKSLVN